MTKTEKYNFRMSSKWKRFRLKLKKLSNYVDAITKRPLTKAWNLHHCDLRDKHYTDISNPGRFVPLNKDTHDFIHWLYKLWCKDKKIISRLEGLMYYMYECTHDNLEVDND